MIKQVDYYMCPKCYWMDEDDIENRNKTHYCSRCGSVSEYEGSEMINTDTNKCVDRMEDYNQKVREAKGITPKPVQSQQPSKPTVTCPYCKSTNTHKISGVYKAASIGLFGLFALPGASKQYTCKDCGADF